MAAAANQRKYLTLKLGFLEEHRDQLVSVVNNQVNKVLESGKAWVEGKRENDEGRVLSYKEMSTLVEDTDMLLLQHVEQLAGGDQEYVVSDTSSAATTTSSSFVTVSAIQTSGESEMVRSALARIQVIEEAVSSLSINVGKLSDTQSEVETSIKEMKLRQSEVDENQSQSSKETEESLKQLTYKQAKTEMEQNKKLEQLEHQLDILEKSQAEMDGKVLHSNEMSELKTSLQTLQTEVDKQKKDLDSLKDHVDQEMTPKLEDLTQKAVKQEKTAKRINKVEQRLGALEEREQEHVEKLESIEKKLAREKIKRENLEAVQNQREQKLEAVERKLDQMETSNISLSSKVEDQESSIQELTETVEKHSTSLEEQDTAIQELTTTVEKHSTSLEEQDTAIQELTTTVEKHSTTLEDIKSNRETEATKLTRVHNKVRVLKREKNTALKNVQKQLEEVTLNYQMVCQIVADRLLPLEKLREILNNKVKNSHENVQKLHTVIQDVADLVPKVSHLENQNKQTITPTVAVTAVVVNITPVKGNIIDKWRCGAGNTGGHFDVNTGIFTAPVAGTYAVALYMYQLNEGKIWLKIMKTPSGRNPSVDNDTPVALANTDRDDSNNCGFSVVDMSVGDKICVCVFHVNKSPTLKGCRFSIFLVK